MGPALLVVGLVAGTASAQDAPAVQISGDGRTATAGSMTLSTSQAAGITPGQAVTVSGRGFDVEKGVYVALCVVPPTGMPPSPCGGGQDRSGTGGVSEWVSSNPPSYARGLTVPYGAGGTFTITMSLGPDLPDGLDCYSVRCAIYTRADHTRTSDRSLDVGIPVTFSAAAPTTAAPPPPPPTAAPETTTTTEAPTTTSTTEAPTTTSTTAASQAGDDGDEGAADEEADDQDSTDEVALAVAGRDDGRGSSPTLPILLVGVALVVAGGVGARVLISRRRSPDAGETAP